MNQHDRGRRSLLRHSALAVGAVAAPLEVIGASALPPFKREEWHIFKSGMHYGARVNAIKTMKANTNVNDPASWAHPVAFRFGSSPGNRPDCARKCRPCPLFA